MSISPKRGLPLSESEPMPERNEEGTAPEPEALLPSEVVCRNDGCNLAYHKHLPSCPVCKELAR